ncbi:MAG: TIR domain-containing protein, partial [Pseudomonadota bacterium]
MSTDREQQHRVFLSHSNKDHTVATAVCDYLEAHDIRCWIAPRDIEPGASWASTIIDALTRCDVLVLVFSEHANASRQVLREIERAVQRGCKILTYRIDDTAPGADLEYFLSTEQWLDARQQNDESLAALHRAVERAFKAEDLAAAARSIPLPKTPAKGGGWKPWAVMGSVAALAATLWFAVPRSSPQPETPLLNLPEDGTLSVAVLPFENRSDTDELGWLSDALAEMVITDLSQAEALRVLSNQELYASVPEELIMAGMMGEQQELNEFVDQAGVGAVLSGNYAQLGESLQVSLSLVDADTGELIISRRSAGAAEDVFEIVDELSLELRQALRTDTDELLDRDLKEVTTESLEAYRFYVQGLQLDLRLKREEAIPLLQEAVRIDPSFAMAHARLGWIQQNIGRAAEARSSFNAAFSHRDRLPIRERLLVEGLKYGDSWDSYHLAVDAFQNALTLDPSLHSARHQLATTYAKMELVDEAMSEWQLLREAGYDYPGVENGLANM